MFVSVLLDPSTPDSAKALSTILIQYGFKKIQRCCFENSAISEKQLELVKKDVDRVTDYYDVVRFYQYPVEGFMAISALAQKHWTKSVLRPPKSEMQPKTNVPRQ